MKQRGFYEIDESDEGRELPVLYFFPAPLRLKLKQIHKLDIEPDFAIVQGGKVLENDEKIIPAGKDKLKFALYTLNKGTNGEWFFNTVENPTSKLQESVQKYVAGITTNKNEFAILEEFPPQELLEGKEIKITHQGFRFIYRGKNS